MPFYKISEETGRIEIYFENFPSNSTRQFLKENRWRWNPTKKCWWNFDNDHSRKIAEKLCPTTIKPIKKQQKEEGMLQKGICGLSAFWAVINERSLIIAGSGEITGYGYDQRECSPWHDVRDKIQDIKVLNGITTIGKRAFYDFSNLLTVELSGTITSIQDYAFSGCRKLESIRLPNYLRELGMRAFRGCTSLRELHIPQSVEIIGGDCFQNWTPQQTIYRTKRDVRTGQYIETAYSPNSTQDGTVSEIFFEDFVAVTTNNHCVQSGHIVETIQAKVNVLRRDGTVQAVMLPARYCQICKKYTIGAWQFEKLKSLGVIMCRIVHETAVNGNSSGNFYSDLSPESILKQYGYSVNAADDLSEEQRRQILVNLMETGICKQTQILSHLSWLIQTREGRADLLDAVWKWKNDRDFVDSYQMGTGRVVAIRSLKVRG